MSLVIRLAPMGRKGERKYQIVVKEKRDKRDGKAVDIIGHYTKTVKTSTKHIDQDKLKLWQSRGAELSTGVKRIL